MFLLPPPPQARSSSLSISIAILRNATARSARWTTYRREPSDFRSRLDDLRDPDATRSDRKMCVHVCVMLQRHRSYNANLLSL